MEIVKLILNGQSIGSILVDSDGVISEVNVDEESLLKISHLNLLGKKIDNDDYYSITTSI
jgi:nitrogen fixation/metabolism regulation signal transduction histidine kinase